MKLRIYINKKNLVGKIKHFEEDLDRFKKTYKNEVLVEDLENKIKIELEIQFKENKKFICTMIKPPKKLLSKSKLPEIYNNKEHTKGLIEKNIIVQNTEFGVTPCIQMNGRTPLCRGNRRVINCVYDKQTEEYEYYGNDSIRGAYEEGLLQFIIYIKNMYKGKDHMGESRADDENKILTKLVDVICKKDREKIEYMLEKIGYNLKEYHNTQVVLSQEFVDDRNKKMICRAKSRHEQIIKNKKTISHVKDVLGDIGTKERNYWDVRDKKTYTKYTATHIFKLKSRNYFILKNDNDVALASIGELKNAKIGDVFNVEARAIGYSKLDTKTNNKIKFKYEYDVVISNSKVIDMELPFEDQLTIKPKYNMLKGLHNVYDFKFILDGNSVNEILGNIYEVLEQSMEVAYMVM